MTADPSDTIEEWGKQTRAGHPPSELTGFVLHEFPEAAQRAAEHSAPLRPSGVIGVDPARKFLRRHLPFWLHFGWSSGFEFESWRCLVAYGAQGLVRLSGRPEALSQVLREDAPVLTGEDADVMAVLLAPVVLPEGPPDSYAMVRFHREARRRSTVLTQGVLSLLDGDSRGELVPLDAAAWRAARAGLTPPLLELVPGGGIVTFHHLDGTQQPGSIDDSALFRVLRCRCALAAGSYVLRSQIEELGLLGFQMPAQVIPGRALHLGGQRRQARLGRAGW